MRSPGIDRVEGTYLLHICRTLSALINACVLKSLIHHAWICSVMHEAVGREERESRVTRNEVHAALLLPAGRGRKGRNISVKWGETRDPGSKACQHIMYRLAVYGRLWRRIAVALRGSGTRHWRIRCRSDRSLFTVMIAGIANRCRNDNTYLANSLFTGWMVELLLILLSRPHHCGE